MTPLISAAMLLDSSGIVSALPGWLLVGLVVVAQSPPAGEAALAHGGHANLGRGSYSAGYQFGGESAVGGCWQ